MGTNIIAQGADEISKTIAQRISMKLSKQQDIWLCYVSYNLPKPNQQQQQQEFDMTPNLQLFAEKQLGQYLKTIQLI